MAKKEEKQEVRQDDKQEAQPNKSLEEVAQEAVAGKWGVGQERRLKLQQAGYDPREVEAEVVRLRNEPLARRNANADQPEGQVTPRGTAGGERAPGTGEDAGGSEARGSSTGPRSTTGGEPRTTDVEDRGSSNRRT
jgi:CW_7 repeat